MPNPVDTINLKNTPQEQDFNKIIINKQDIANRILSFARNKKSYQEEIITLLQSLLKNLVNQNNNCEINNNIINQGELNYFLKNRRSWWQVPIPKTCKDLLKSLSISSGIDMITLSEVINHKNIDYKTAIHIYIFLQKNGINLPFLLDKTAKTVDLSKASEYNKLIFTKLAQLGLWDKKRDKPDNNLTISITSENNKRNVIINDYSIPLNLDNKSKLLKLMYSNLSENILDQIFLGLFKKITGISYIKFIDYCMRDNKTFKLNTALDKYSNDEEEPELLEMNDIINSAKKEKIPEIKEDFNPLYTIIDNSQTTNFNPSIMYKNHYMCYKNSGKAIEIEMKVIEGGTSVNITHNGKNTFSANAQQLANPREDGTFPDHLDVKNRKYIFPTSESNDVCGINHNQCNLKIKTVNDCLEHEYKFNSMGSYQINHNNKKVVEDAKKLILAQISDQSSNTAQDQSPIYFIDYKPLKLFNFGGNNYDIFDNHIQVMNKAIDEINQETSTHKPKIIYLPLCGNSYPSKLARPLEYAHPSSDKSLKLLNTSHKNLLTILKQVDEGKNYFTKTISILEKLVKTTITNFVDDDSTLKNSEKFLLFVALNRLFTEEYKREFNACNDEDIKKNSKIKPKTTIHTGGCMSAKDRAAAMLANTNLIISLYHHKGGNLDFINDDGLFDEAKLSINDKKFMNVYLHTPSVFGSLSQAGIGATNNKNLDLLFCNIPFLKCQSSVLVNTKA